MPKSIQTLRVILGDQCSLKIPTLSEIDKKNDVILMMEVGSEASYVPHHKQKIAFIFSVMRNFAADLEAQGFKVHYIKLNDPKNTQNFENEITRAAQELSPQKICITESGEYRVAEILKTLQKNSHIPFEILEDSRFLASHQFFQNWAKDKKSLRMEFFYREMRKKYNILLEKNGNPIGGAWNFDKENRKTPTGKLNIPPRPKIQLNTATIEVLKLVEQKFPNNFGSLQNFIYATTREGAAEHADYFFKNYLSNFGDYQDAMLIGEAFLYHSLLSAYLNIGLLDPLDLCKRAEEEFIEGRAPLNAVEGYIRQILGWREYVRGLYWLHMPEYKELNFLKASKPLPEFYWTASTKMNCMKEAISHTRDYAYAHHIHRLMVTGNFALLAGINPSEVCDWYLAVYADAYEWVELPNTLGMALFGDGGIMASKPYAASGAYINRMSNYCKNCTYKVDKTTEDNACPFNALYWNFIERNEDKLRGNGRMVYMYATWDKMSAAKKSAIKIRAKDIFEKMKKGEL